DGKPVHPFMPYWALGNMRDEDAEAIVAYLRSVPGVEHMLPPSEPPFRTPERAAERWPLEQIPEPSDAAPERAAGLRGRYLAAEVGLCMACHTPRGDDGSPVYANAFQGGRQLMAAQFEWATPSIAGLGAGAIDALAMKIKHAHGPALCPDPAPLGQSPFEALRDEDARDIAHYLASLPPSPTTTPAVCRSTAGR
ncbi:MAG TPA: c-type cytochrome, partial [Polyangiales bacterium]|nr:c-type cytochrome [Polyangiales bacterium]